GSEIQGAQPEKDAQSQAETIQNSDRRLALPGREKPDGEIPSLDQNPFGRSIGANCLSRFFGEEEDEKIEQGEQPRQRRDVRVQEKQKEVRCALLALQLVTACLPLGQRSFTNPFRSDRDDLRSISLVVTAEEQNPLPLALQAGGDGRACPMQTRTQAE